jgi:hypothetical protein
MVVGLVLPERLAGSHQYLVCFAGSESFERLQKPAGSNSGCSQKMNMIRHDDKGVEFIVPEIFVASLDCLLDQARDFCPAEMRRAGSGGIQAAIDPHERLARAQLTGRGIESIRKAAVQMLRQEKRSALGMHMGQTPPTLVHLSDSLKHRSSTAKVQAPLSGGVSTRACRVETLLDAWPRTPGRLDDTEIPTRSSFGAPPAISTNGSTQEPAGVPARQAESLRHIPCHRAWLFGRAGHAG